jgi:hypothetical protein
MCLSKNPNRTAFADLLVDPFVRMVMRADRVAEHQPIELMGVTFEQARSGIGN